MNWKWKENEKDRGDFQVFGLSTGELVVDLLRNQDRFLNFWPWWVFMCSLSFSFAPKVVMRGLSAFPACLGIREGLFDSWVKPRSL